MKDSRNDKLWERVINLSNDQKITLLAFIFGYESDCKHFHDGIEDAIRVHEWEI